MTKNNFKNIVELRSDTMIFCGHCDSSYDIGRLERPINHYIKEHGYTLISIIQNSVYDDNRKIYQEVSVAYLGK